MGWPPPRETASVVWNLMNRFVVGAGNRISWLVQHRVYCSVRFAAFRDSDTCSHPIGPEDSASPDCCPRTCPADGKNPSRPYSSVRQSPKTDPSGKRSRSWHRGTTLGPDTEKGSHVSAQIPRYHQRSPSRRRSPGPFQQSMQRSTPGGLETDVAESSVGNLRYNGMQCTSLLCAYLMKM